MMNSVGFGSLITCRFSALNIVCSYDLQNVIENKKEGGDGNLSSHTSHQKNRDSNSTKHKVLDLCCFLSYRYKYDLRKILI